MRITLSIVALLTLSAPAFAQSVDFGDDASQWSNDGQCDDMRFEGPGMTSTLLLDSDVGHDATDCMTAFNQGRLSLASVPGTTPAQIITPAPTTTANSGGGLGGSTKGGSEQSQSGGNTGMPNTGHMMVDGIDFGDDDNPFSTDGECDDRRFIGSSMSAVLGWEHLGHDATDCVAGYQAGNLRLWNAQDAQAATQCTAIDFGDDSGDFPTDSECDDIRFEGLGSALNLRVETIGQDASDCQRLCDYGLVSLRDY